MSSSRRLDFLDGLRGLAILWVAWLHFWQISWATNTVQFFGWSIDFDFIATTGGMGVDLFFFLSGFCLFYGYLQNPTRSWRDFAYRRAIKILPSYYFSIALILLVLEPRGISSHGTLKDLFTHLFFVHNWLPETLSSINGVFWSLAIEVQFYVLFPLIRRTFDRHPWALTAVAFAISTVYRVWLLVAHQDLPFLMKQLPAVIELFAFGMLAAKVVAGARKIQGHEGRFALLAVLSFIACLAIVGHAATWRYQPGLDVWEACFRSGLGVAIFALAVCSARASRIWVRFLANPVLTFLSAISYNLYLWHQYLARLLLTNRMPAYVGEDPHRDPRWQLAFTVVAITLSVSVSWLLTRYLEKPFLERGVRGVFRRLALGKAVAEKTPAR